MARRKKVTPAPGSIVLVGWEDILEHNAWQDTLTPAPEVSNCQSVGFVVSWGADYVVLTRTWHLGADGKPAAAGDKITYPAGVVKTWEVLR